MKPYGLATFCDDIRREHDGKITIVGSFHNEISVPTVPTIIPQLGIVCHFIIPSEPKRRKIPLFIEFGDSQIDGTGEVILPEDDHLPEEMTMRHVTTNAMFTPFEIDQEGVLTVKAVLEDKPVIIGQLHICSEQSLIRRTKPKKKPAAKKKVTKGKK